MAKHKNKNDISLKEHVLALDVLRDKLADERHLNYNRQFDALRAFQHEAIEQHSHFITDDVYRNRHEDLEKRIVGFVERIESLEGRGKGRVELWGWIVAGVGMLVAILGLLISHSITNGASP